MRSYYFGCCLPPSLCKGGISVWGMVGLDTGHVIAFTKLLHDRTITDHVAGTRVVGAVKTGSPDIAI